MTGNLFCLPRDIWTDDALGEEPLCRHAAWAWMVSQACWKSQVYRHHGKDVPLARGQFAGASRKLAAEWRWVEPKVRRFLDALEDRRRIERVTDAGINVITICGYMISSLEAASLTRELTREPTRV